jgi:hypothetical protein
MRLQSRCPDGRAGKLVLEILAAIQLDVLATGTSTGVATIAVTKGTIAAARA